jgi:hypothetical protein
MQYLCKYLCRSESEKARGRTSSNNIFEENRKLTTIYRQPTAKSFVKEKLNRKEQLHRILPDSTGFPITS